MLEWRSQFYLGAAGNEHSQWTGACGQDRSRWHRGIIPERWFWERVPFVFICRASLPSQVVAALKVCHSIHLPAIYVHWAKPISSPLQACTWGWLAVNFAKVMRGGFMRAQIKHSPKHKFSTDSFTCMELQPQVTFRWPSCHDSSHALCSLGHGYDHSSAFSLSGFGTTFSGSLVLPWVCWHLMQKGISVICPCCSFKLWYFIHSRFWHWFWFFLKKCYIKVLLLVGEILGAP